MKSITIKGSQRESVGKVATKAVRNAGMVPCVIYGGNNPVHFAAEVKAFKGLVETVLEAHSAPEAVAQAYKIGKKGDTVLLSPACASFDLFENYEDRGTQFKQAVRAL